MSEEDKSQKTEDPTPKKLQDARKEGDVPSTKEVGTVMSILVLTIGVVFLGQNLSTGLLNTLGEAFLLAPSLDINEGILGINDLSLISGKMINKTISTIGPFFILMVFAAIFGQLIQGETVIALKRIQPKLEKISIIKGFKRIFSMKALIEFLKSITKLVIVIIVCAIIIVPTLTSMWSTTLFIPESIPSLLQRKTGILLIIVTCFIVPIAIFDIIWQRSQWIKKNRMSLKEIKDEHKDAEGDPHMKQKRSQKRKELSQNRMKDAIPTATMIIANPTHFSVALRYNKGEDIAPVVVAKGIDSLALKIKEIARENEVPIVENIQLARSLHASTEIDDVIPYESWKAVAEIVNYIIDIKSNLKGVVPPDGSTLEEL
jgi:flagellar biosynthetic protein FlhB